MLNLCTEHDNISKVLEKHPSLGTAATFLAAQFHEEHASADIFRRSPRPAYSLDDDVDDDDDDDDADGLTYPVQVASTSSAPQNANLAQLLREALASANASRPVSDPGASTSRAGQVPVPAPPTPQAAPVASGSRVHASDESSEPPTQITSEMLQMALDSVRPGAATDTPAASQAGAAAGAASVPEQRPRDWTQELQQMHEVGIKDDALCIQALEATNGDVQLALNIIFNQ